MATKSDIDNASMAAAVPSEDDGRGVVKDINVAGHIQELDRNFSLLSLAGVGLVVGTVWPAVGGSILIALYNGGPPGTTNVSDVVSSTLTSHRRSV